ncbi:phospholipase A [Guyparkeria hydrothermalis]|uniref:phospholipase A n=1 Tax=Guyparkeria hydrothermalis TaxID=923 RepID=UPI0020207FD6|nr:phospholipase A [Guyparkeria hydrothermalis]MCL7745269.1 phospholipase A [Guyparkeria hydrothermalis]
MKALRPTAATHRLALPAGLLFATLAGTSQAAAPDWSECAMLDDDAQRLACFDRVASQGVTNEPAEGQGEAVTRPLNAEAQAEGEASAAPKAATDDQASEAEEPAHPVALEQRIRSEKSGERNPFVIRGYKPNYIMPLTYTPTDLSRPEYDFDPQHAETKFQLSFQFDWFQDPLGDNTSLYFGYTQLSLWQTYNSSALGADEDASSPFRETNYEPELGLNVDTNFKLAGLTFRRARLSVIHTSNGQGGDRSRSWNRLATGIAFGRGHFAGRLRGWYRIPDPDEHDNNPDITDYMGHGDLQLAYKWNGQTIAATLRNNLDFDENRGAIEVGYSFPLSNRIKGYVQYFNGYGESLIDYNRSVSRIGMGIALTDWL